MWAIKQERSEARSESPYPSLSPQAPTNVIIVANFGTDVQRYATRFRSLTFPKPQGCPRCAACGHLIGHGSYPRHVCDHNEALVIRVKRFLCTICRHTVSLMPSFCLPYRWYGAAVIQSVLDLRFQQQASWATICRHCAPFDLPVLSTLRDWVGCFARTADRALASMLQQLAVWQREPGKLELLLAELGARPKGPAQLLAAVPHLVVWLRESGFAVPEGVGRWLPTLTRWGYAVKLGRLI